MTAPQLPVNGSLSTLVERCSDDQYVVSQKINGRRLMLVAADGQVSGINKKGEAAVVPFPVAHQASRLRGRWVFDGELIDGTLALFDLAQANSQLDHTTPYNVRRTVLEAVHEHWDPGPSVRLLPVAWTHEEKALLAKRLYEAKAEGCVANHLEAPYTPGDENPGVIKFKFTKTVDCVVIDIGREGKANMAVALYVPGEPEPVEVAEVTACAGDGPQIVQQYLRYLNGKASRPVIEVTYLYASANGRLVQPTLPRLRDDKTPDECTINQLQHESKELLDF